MRGMEVWTLPPTALVSPGETIWSSWRWKTPSHTGFYGGCGPLMANGVLPAADTGRHSAHSRRTCPLPVWDRYSSGLDSYPMLHTESVTGTAAPVWGCQSCTKYEGPGVSVRVCSRPQPNLTWLTRGKRTLARGYLFSLNKWAADGVLKERCTQRFIWWPLVGYFQFCYLLSENS